MNLNNIEYINRLKIYVYYTAHLTHINSYTYTKNKNITIEKIKLFDIELAQF